MPHIQQVRGTIETRARYSSSSTPRRASGVDDIAGATNPREPATAASRAVLATIHGPWRGAPAAAIANVASLVMIPLTTYTNARLSSPRARNSNTAPTTAEKPMQPNSGVPVSAVMTVPTNAQQVKAASRLTSQLWARIDLAATQSVTLRPGSCWGDNPARTMDARAATPSSARLTAAVIELPACNGAAVSTPASAASATATARPETAAKRTNPTPVKRIASTAVASAGIAVSNTWGSPGTPGTARKPVIAANAAATRLSAIPVIGSRNARVAIAAQSSAVTPAAAAMIAVAMRVTLRPSVFRASIRPPMQVRQTAAAAAVSFRARRVQGRSAESSALDTASAASS